MGRVEGEGVFDTGQRHSVRSHAHSLQFHDSFSDTFFEEFCPIFLFFFLHWLLGRNVSYWYQNLPSAQNRKNSSYLAHTLLRV